jgi:hypothetical protein
MDYQTGSGAASERGRMPLVILDALPAGQVIVNTDDIVLVRAGHSHVELVLRGAGQNILLSHSSVADVARDLRAPHNAVEREMANGAGRSSAGR